MGWPELCEKLLTRLEAQGEIAAGDYKNITGEDYVG